VQKRLNFTVFFALSGAAWVKAAQKNIDEIVPLWHMGEN